MNNLPPDLSPEARRIISAARGVDDPTADDHARVKARWLAGVAAVAGVSSLTEMARAAGGVGWGLKAVGAALAVAAGAIGVYLALPEDGSTRSAESRPAWLGQTHERHDKTVALPESEAAPPLVAPRAALPVSAEREPEVLAPAPALVPTDPPAVAEPVPSEPAASPVLDVPADRPAVGVPARPARERAVASRANSAGARESGASATRAATPRAQPVAAAPVAAAAEAAVPAAEAASGQLGEELSVLSEVRSSVRDGAPQRALELLASYEARFGRPILGMEADALRVDALCRAGQREAARASAAAFQNEWPGSPLESRVNAACP